MVDRRIDQTLSYRARSPAADTAAAVSCGGFKFKHISSFRVSRSDTFSFQLYFERATKLSIRNLKYVLVSTERFPTFSGESMFF